ncbi:TPA: hypothetical protein ACH3X3_000659 [Trebouxia sp. C0006]
MSCGGGLLPVTSAKGLLSRQEATWHMLTYRGVSRDHSLGFGSEMSRLSCPRRHKLRMSSRNQMQTSEHERTQVDIHSPYRLSDTQVQSYKDSGFLRLPGVFDTQTLAHYTPTMSLEVAKADKAPLEEDSDYQKAFTQIMNIWVESKPVKEFVLGQKLGRIASELMGVDGVRIYHDQALNKEPGGGYTPWHCDGYYWPLQSDKILTAWVPLQAVPEEMGPLQFAARSHTHDLGRDLGIGGQAHQTIDAAVKQGGFEIINEPFELGEVSFHSGWTFHQAAGNGTDAPREVFTIIFMDKDMIMAEPLNHNQRLDHDRWLPGVMPGKVCDSPLNPVVWSKDMGM